MEKVLCCNCGNEIPEGRLKALPGVKTCVACSTTGRVQGRAVITGKTTYSELELVSPEKLEELNRLDREAGHSYSKPETDRQH